MNSKHLSWRAWRFLAAAYGLGWAIGLVVVTDMWLGLTTAYLLAMGWLAITRQKDRVWRWVPGGYISGGAVALTAPFNDFLSLGYVLVVLIVVSWLALLSTATIWLGHRFGWR